MKKQYLVLIMLCVLSLTLVACKSAEDERADKALINMHSKDYSVRGDAYRELNKLLGAGNRKALTGLLRVLKEKDENFDKYEVIDQLIWTAPPEVLGELLTILKDPNEPNEEKLVRAMGYPLYPYFTPPDSPPWFRYGDYMGESLRKIVTENESIIVRRRALKVLGKSLTSREKGKESIEKYGSAIISALYDSDKEIRLIAAHIMRRLQFKGEPREYAEELIRQDEVKMNKYLYSCTVDFDCTKVLADCCGCGGNGMTTSINKEYEKWWRTYKYSKTSYQCSGTVCLGMLSNNPGCFAPPQCINGQCTLDLQTGEKLMQDDTLEDEERYKYVP